MSETNSVLTKKDLTKTLTRYVLARQICFNYETMQSGGWVWSMHPAMKKIYGDDQVLSEKYKSYFKFFNTNPWFGNLILMACLAVESTKDEMATETAVDIRTGLMGPLAGLGDAIVWVLLPTVMGAIAGYQAMQGSAIGWLLAEAVGIALWIAFWKMSYVVYHQGISFITSKSSSLKNLTDVCSIMGLIVIGAMVASTVNVNIALSWTVGDLTQKLGDLLDSIIPHFGNVFFTVLIYLGLGIKKMTSGKMVWIVLILSILLGAFGICA
ncbi:PTS system mannose/fructose/sorbose family transporter subunit IID [Clostridium sp. KNHs216]|jgi:Phosphotransferase system, mannose/fructose/N-acetylgalactosamine-specific component IID|uniref:PTS system mannose/fructose/sorbose family transporter subunit IID n=1 Tax=Eubacteriales TaxID=186802 RepID=UPI001153EB7A|nr:PTS system mannose/fructose/sorbose family transporter subunit IID [Clostridium sp. KNHs216]TQI68348.1 PTS system IID component (Man family) [Clostridium sp. KNHs216]